MSGIEYCFGTGDAAVNVWTSAADLDLGASGETDAVGLDFDGDGRFDDAMWDSNADGIADLAALDIDDDGVFDHFYADPSGHGVWDRSVQPPGSTTDGSDHVTWTDGRGESRYVERWSPGLMTVAYQGDGVIDDAVIDVDHDRQADVVLIGGTKSRYSGMLVSGHPDVALVDSDGDGVLDATIGRGEPGFIG
jgi:hypothetical protein